MDVAERRLTPDEIGVDFVPKRRAGVAEAQLGEEWVIALAPFEPCHLLNPTAGLVWQSFDGEANLSTLIDEFAEAVGVSPNVIGPDVLELTRHLGRLGLLEDVTPEAVGDQVAAAPEPLSKGDVIEDFELSDLRGLRRAWTDFRDRRILLVNWSISCGYCLQIAPELAQLGAHLEKQGVGLVFITSGSPEDNQPYFDEAGMGEATVLCKEGGADPFAGLGTPAAYLVDERGQVSEPLAYGALEVPDLIARVAGVERKQGDDSARYLSGGAGVCGPGSMTIRRKTEWAGLAAYDLGELRVGLRYNTADTAEVLDRLFPGARVEDPNAQENYSVALYPANRGGARDLNLLVRSGLQVTRSRSGARVLRALVGHLSYVLSNPDPALLQVDGIAVVRAGEAFVLPSILYNMWSLVQPRLSRLGLQVIDRPWVSIDPRRTEVVVDEPELPHDPRVIEELEPSSLRFGTELPGVPLGRYPLRTWIFADSDRPEGTLSQASAVAQSMGLVTWVPGLDVVLGQLGTLLERARGYSMPYEGAEPFMDKLPTALGWDS